ncbi:AI-2E family transporter [Cyclobacterium jeungdonense]|uniref:AI-2E family transporter n=1 Tax=Cyclobacterium jeungdonense TaxID=708087 RepID=A0ABT8CBD6_9BACT|nr:AI-2E family transporter [Cyclobacterium jeungdonense]MDN3690115.1 AI-2E family transporter [Cyclobacterium jeungdonense]
MKDKKEEEASTPSNRTDTTSFTEKVLISAGIIIPIILILWLFGVAFKVLLLILAAGLVAALFRGIADYIHRYVKIPMGWSLLVSVLLVIGFFALAGFLIAPQVGDQVNQLAEKFPETVQSARDQLNQSKQGRKLLDQIPEDPQKWLQEKSGVLKQSMGVFSATFGVLTDLYIIFFIGMFIMAQPEPYQKGIVSLVPIPNRERAQEVLDKLGITLQRWIAGKLFSMLVVAVLTSLGLWLLGVPLALALGFIAGLLAFVPNFGPLVALIPAVLVGLMEGPSTALYVVLLYIGIQAVESNLITPLVQKQMVYLPPAVLLIGQVLLGILVGGLGLILATPIIAIVMVLVKMLYVENVLGDSPSGEGE